MLSNRQSTQCFWLGVTGETLHAIVSVIGPDAVEQRAACGSKLLEDDEPCVPYDCKTTAFQVINFKKKLCKRCASIESGLATEVRKEIKFWLAHPP